MAIYNFFAILTILLGLSGCKVNEEQINKKKELLDVFFWLMKNDNDSCPYEFEKISLSYGNAIVVLDSKREDVISKFRSIISNNSVSRSEISLSDQIGVIEIISGQLKLRLPIFDSSESQLLYTKIIIPGDKGGYSVMELPIGKKSLDEFIEEVSNPDSK